jgi:hypothetical protein
MTSTTRTRRPAVVPLGAAVAAVETTFSDDDSVTRPWFRNIINGLVALRMLKCRCSIFDWLGTVVLKLDTEIHH